jgi:hypothetical protein
MLVEVHQKFLTYLPSSRLFIIFEIGILYSIIVEGNNGLYFLHCHSFLLEVLLIICIVLNWLIFLGSCSFDG